jgi:hypothetical protein
MIAGLLLAVGCALATSVSVLLKQRARGTLFLSEYPRQPEVREGAVAAEPGDRGGLLALEGQDEHSVQSGDLGPGGGK